MYGHKQVPLVAIMVIALSLGIATSAYALPEFTKNGTFVTKNSGVLTPELLTKLSKVTCTANSFVGTINAGMIADGITGVFTGCKSPLGSCTTPGKSVGTIATEVLLGELGLYK